MAQKVRNESMDVAKGAAMLAIIYSHLGIFHIMRVLNAFHVTVFFVVSGYFISKSRPVGKFVKHRFRTILVPYFVSCLVLIAFSVVRDLLGGDISMAWQNAKIWTYASLYGFGMSVDWPFFIQGIGPLWYLWAAFWAGVILRISLNYSTPVRLLIIFGCFALGWSSVYWCPFFWPFSLQAGLCDAFFMYCGFLWKKAEARYNALALWKRALIVGACLLVWADFILEFYDFGLVTNYFNRGVIDIIAALCASFVIIRLCVWITDHTTWIKKYLNFVGLYSILFLCFHGAEMLTINWNGMQPALGLLMGEHRFLFFLAPFRIILLSLVVWLVIRIPVVRKIFCVPAPEKKPLRQAA